jgi:hypothetical protein
MYPSIGWKIDWSGGLGTGGDNYMKSLGRLLNCLAFRRFGTKTMLAKERLI